MSHCLTLWFIVGLENCCSIRGLGANSQLRKTSNRNTNVSRSKVSDLNIAGSVNDTWPLENEREKPNKGVKEKISPKVSTKSQNGSKIKSSRKEAE